MNSDQMVTNKGPRLLCQNFFKGLGSRSEQRELLEISVDTLGNGHRSTLVVEKLTEAQV